jgi:hypothetical protein
VNNNIFFMLIKIKISFLNILQKYNLPFKLLFS